MTRYFWVVRRLGRVYRVKAVSAQTAIYRALRGLGAPLFIEVRCERQGKVERVKCEVCGHYYDTDDRSGHELCWYHKTALKDRLV